MKISIEEVRRVALLARLRLTAEEEKRFAEQLDKILRHVENLDQLDTLEIEPFVHELDAANSFREDRVTNSPRAQDLLANAPDTYETFFKVPKIIE